MSAKSLLWPRPPVSVLLQALKAHGAALIVLPEGLRCLRVWTAAQDCLLPGVLPDSLEELVVGGVPDRPLELEVLPRGLRRATSFASRQQRGQAQLCLSA